MSPWIAALTLDERVALFKAIGSVNVSAGEHPTLLAQSWSHLQPFRANPDLLMRRAALLAITPAELESVARTPLSSLAQALQLLPQWAQAIESTLADDSAALHAEPPGVVGTEAQTVRPFAVVAAPFIARARAEMRDRLACYAQVHRLLPIWTPQLTDLLLGDISGLAAHMVARAAVLEMNIQRLGEGRSSPNNNGYRAFLDTLQSANGRRQFFETYPVLARAIERRLRHRVEACTVLIQHLCDSWPQLRRTFGLSTSDSIRLISERLGDPHRNGIAVRRIEFASGRSVVYKPRSLLAEQRFHRLERWLCDHGFDLDFYTPHMVVNIDHGWVEYLMHRSCVDGAAFDRFYRRLGAQLALLHLLLAVDVHFENVMAVGEYPVLIDLESILHQHLRSAHHEPTPFTDSVLRVGVLPNQIRRVGDPLAIDISAFSAGVQPHPLGVPTWIDAGTDAMHMITAPAIFGDGHHRPTLSPGSRDKLSNARTTEIEALADGFRQAGETISRQRESFTAFVSQELSRIPGRMLLRPTLEYARILTGLNHPACLSNGLARDQYLDRIWCNAKHSESRDDLLAAERNDLANDDVPYFRTMSTSRSIWDSRGLEYRDALPTTGLEAVRSRVGCFNEDELQRQLWFVRSSCVVAMTGRVGRRFVLPDVAAQVSQDELIAGALRFGQRLIRLRLGSGARTTWATVVPRDDDSAWRVAQCGPELYDGVLGIAYFLAHLGAVTGIDRYKDVALDAAEGAYRDHFDQPMPIGAYTGLGGLLCVACRFASLWPGTCWDDRINVVLSAIRGAIAADTNFDLIGGAAGCILALAVSARAKPVRLEALRGIKSCMDHICVNAAPQRLGVGWPSGNEGPLTGLSHGASGIAWALCVAAKLLADAGGAGVARQAWLWENSTFDASRGNWPDFRSVSRRHSSSDEVAYMMSWCHGAPGIALARGEMWALTGDAAYLEDALVGQATTARHGFGFNHTLCHGDLGNVEILLRLGELTAANQPKLESAMYSDRIVRHLLATGPICATPTSEAVETPGMMQGLAGIGYQLLRLARPDIVPSILVLTPAESLEPLDLGW